MITVAVASGDTAANEYYRGLMADAKLDAIFTPEIDQLTRCVKSKPVDLILFDLTSPMLSATSWLEAVREDKDLALTPVLWVGMARPMALATTLDNYRPGARIRQRPNLTSLMELVQRIVGRTTASEDNTPDPIESSKEWKPEGETIDDALSIFAESELANGRKQAKLIDDDSDEDDFQTSEIRRAAPRNHAKPLADGGAMRPSGEVLSIPSSGPEEKVMIDLSEGESDTEFESDPGSSTRTTTSAVARRPAKVQVPPGMEELVDEIADKVISRLAAEVFKNIDTRAIRQIVRDVLAERGK